MTKLECLEKNHQGEKDSDELPIITLLTFKIQKMKKTTTKGIQIHRQKKATLASLRCLNRRVKVTVQITNSFENSPCQLFSAK